jgi:hypothetical protein
MRQSVLFFSEERMQFLRNREEDARVAGGDRCERRRWKRKYSDAFCQALRQAKSVDALLQLKEFVAPSEGMATRLDNKIVRVREESEAERLAAAGENHSFWDWLLGRPQAQS